MTSTSTTPTFFTPRGPTCCDVKDDPPTPRRPTLVRPTSPRATPNVPFYLGGLRKSDRRQRAIRSPPLLIRTSQEQCRIASVAKCPCRRIHQSGRCFPAGGIRPIVLRTYVRRRRHLNRRLPGSTPGPSRNSIQRSGGSRSSARCR